MKIAIMLEGSGIIQCRTSLSWEQLDSVVEEDDKVLCVAEVIEERCL